jgi:hypothetical protein
MCDAERTPAPEVERLAIEHLSEFVGSLDTWLADLASESHDEQRRREADIARDQAALADLHASRARHLASYSKLVEAGDALAALALEPIRAIDEQIGATERMIADAQALVAEWDGAPDLETAAETYAELQALAAGRIAQARGARAVNEALREVLSGMWLDWDPQAERVLGEFKLRTPRSLRRPRLLRPPGPLADEFPARDTSQSTLVYRRLTSTVIDEHRCDTRVPFRVNGVATRCPPRARRIGFEKDAVPQEERRLSPPRAPAAAFRRCGPLAGVVRGCGRHEACSPNVDASPDDRASAVIGSKLTVIAPGEGAARARAPVRRWWRRTGRRREARRGEDRALATRRGASRRAGPALSQAAPLSRLRWQTKRQEQS